MKIPVLFFIHFVMNIFHKWINMKKNEAVDTKVNKWLSKPVHKIQSIPSLYKCHWRENSFSLQGTRKWECITNWMWCEWQKLVTTSWIKIISLLLRCRLLITENALCLHPNRECWPLIPSHRHSWFFVCPSDWPGSNIPMQHIFLLVKMKNSLNSIYVCSAHSSDEKMWCPKAVHLLQVPTYLISFGLSIGNEYTHRIASPRIMHIVSNAITWKLLSYQTICRVTSFTR